MCWSRLPAYDRRQPESRGSAGLSADRRRADGRARHAQRPGGWSSGQAPGRVVEVGIRRPGALGPVAGRGGEREDGRHVGQQRVAVARRCPRGTGGPCRACAPGSTADCGACGSSLRGEPGRVAAVPGGPSRPAGSTSPARGSTRASWRRWRSRPRRRRGAPCCTPPALAGLDAGIDPDCGNSVKTTPSTPLPGASMVATAWRSSFVYWAGWCSALGVVGPYWSQLHEATMSWARVWRMRLGSDVGQLVATVEPEAVDGAGGDGGLAGGLERRRDPVATRRA